MSNKRYGCRYCSKRFNSLESVKQHSSVVHECEAEESNLPDAPVGFENQGEWVLREDFPGRKSFGYFDCTGCSTWLSAHGHKENYMQECKECNTWSYAVYLWLNYDRSRTNKAGGSGKPHMKERCQACINGDYCVRG